MISQITVDGNTNDWNGIETNEQQQGNVDNANIDIVSTNFCRFNLFLCINYYR